MIEPGFVVYKYQHGDPVVSGWWVWAVWWVVFLLLACSILFLGPVGIVLTVITVILTFKRWPKRQINVGPRYLVCGNTIAYYKNVTRMALRPGHLVLFWGNNQSFKLSENAFPTNARKTHKITANKAAKFKKVSEKIVQRVLAESPNVALEGLTRKGVPEVQK